MKKTNPSILFILTLLIVAFAFPNPVLAAPIEDDRTIFGSNYTLESGRILDGNLNVIGGFVEIKEGASVNGNMFVLGGLVDINGTIRGNLTVIGGTVTLEEKALIEGDLISPASYINRDPGATIKGNMIESWAAPWSAFDMPRVAPFKPIQTNQIRILPMFTKIGKNALSILVMAALGALLLLVMPKSAETMTSALSKAPWQILGYGALTAVVMLIGGILLSITICLIPVVILAGLAVGLALLAGWLALGYELGKRIAREVFKTTWHPVLTSLLGNFLLYLLALGLDLIPCLGGFLVFVASLFGLGMVVVTLFGTKPYPPGTGVNKFDDHVVLNETTAGQTHPPAIHAQPVAEVSPRLIEDLHLETHAENALRDAGIVTIDDLLHQFSQGETTFLEIDGLDPQSLHSIKKALAQLGFEIPGSPAD